MWKNDRPSMASTVGSSINHQNRPAYRAPAFAIYAGNDGRPPLPTYLFRAQNCFLNPSVMALLVKSVLDVVPSRAVKSKSLVPV